MPEDYNDYMEEDGRIWRECWDCGGEGVTHHDCGEDTCCCLNPVDNVRCETCNGDGGWYLSDSPDDEGQTGRDGA